VPPVDPAFSLWIMAADGANPRQLVERIGLNNVFGWLGDGSGLVHVGAGRQLYLLDLATKEERRLTDEPGVMPILATTSDGQWVIYQCVVGDSIDLHAVSSRGGPSRVAVRTAALDYHPSVSPSGRWLYFYADHKDLFRVPGPAQEWAPAPPQRITDWHLTSQSFIEAPQISRDGRQLAYSRGRITGDVWLLTLDR
jgi:Tol biopolymer transport system component